MIPFVLSIIGGYLIGSGCNDCEKSQKPKFKTGGDVDMPKFKTDYKWLKKDNNYTEVPYYIKNKN